MRLRARALVRIDHEQEEVDARCAGDHRAHEPLVAGHVDDGELRSVRQLERRVAEVDRDAALLLLRQPVGVLAGQRLDERRLAVVDVAGGTDGERHARTLAAYTRADVLRRLIWGDAVVLYAAAAFELALALGAAHVGSEPGDDAPGASVAVAAWSLATLVGVVLAVIGATRHVRWTALLAPAPASSSRPSSTPRIRTSLRPAGDTRTEAP